MIQIAIQIECLRGTKFFDPDCNLDCDPGNFALCKQGIIVSPAVIKKNKFNGTRKLISTSLYQ